MGSGVRNDTGFANYTAGEAIEIYKRVKYDTTARQVLKSGAGEDWIGIAFRTVASGDPLTVMLRTKPGTLTMVASAAITAGAAVYGSADGKVATTAVGQQVGIAVEAASGDGSHLEVLGVQENSFGADVSAVGIWDDFTDSQIGQYEEIILDTIEASSIADADEVRYKLHGSGEIISIFARAITPITTAAKTTTATASLNAVAITGAAGAWATADFGTAGNEKEYVATGANVYTHNDVLKIVFSSTTAFAEGRLQIGIRVRKDDLATWLAHYLDGGSVLCADGAAGTCTLTSGAVDNDEVYAFSVFEQFKPAANKPLWLEAKVTLTEGNTDDANVFVGLMDAPAADALVDDGAGPKTSGSMLGFYKVDGGTNWFSISSVGATQNKDDSGTARVSGTAVTLRIEFDPGTGVTDGTVRFYIDGTLEHTETLWDYTSVTDMALCFGVKAGGANAEVLAVDYVACEQAR